MASPQCEGGYTKVSNELLQALFKYVTNPSWLRIALLVIRVTYGFHRKDTVSNYKSFTTWLNLTEEYIKQVLAEMHDVGLIFYEPKNTFKFKIQLNKNYEEWKISK